MSKKRDHEAILKEMRERYEAETSYWKPHWEQGDKDMRTLSVDGDWDPAARADREAAKRPVTHTDIVSQFNNRVVNQARMRKRGFTFVSSGPNATDKTAQLRESRARQIQYESKAFSARICGLQNSVDRGIGHWKITTERKNQKSFDQTICIERIPNVRSVVIDSRTRKADRSDIRYAWHIDKRYTEDEFRAEFPEASVHSFSDEHRSKARGWIGSNDILVAQYYCVEKTRTKLLLIEGYPMSGKETPVLQTDLPDGTKITEDGVDFGNGQIHRILKQDKSEASTVMIYLTNGIEILEESEWVGSTIPIMTVTGREKYVGDEMEIESMTRKMRQPQMTFDFAESAEVEDVGMSPKPKWLVALGQVEDLPEWLDPNKNNYQFLRWRVEVEGKEVPQPKRVDSSVDVSKYEMLKNSSLRAAQNAVGMTSADAKDRVSKSGIAQEKLDQSADIASFHFTDNWDEAIEYEGRIINEILDKVEDTQRTVGLRSKDDQFSTQDLNVLQGADGEVVEHPYGAADDHGVTVEVGPDYQSQRDEAKEFIGRFMESIKGTPLFDRAAYLLVQYQNLGPVFDKLVENITPADIRQAQDAEKNGQPPIPPQVQKQLQAMQQHLQQVMAMVKQQAHIIDSKIVETNSRKEIELGKAELQKTVEMAKLSLDKYKIDTDYRIALTKTNAQASSDAAALENAAILKAEQHAFDHDMGLLDHARGRMDLEAEQAHEQTMQIADISTRQSSAEQDGQGEQ